MEDTKPLPQEQVVPAQVPNLQTPPPPPPIPMEEPSASPVQEKPAKKFPTVLVVILVVLIALVALGVYFAPSLYNVLKASSVWQKYFSQTEQEVQQEEEEVEIGIAQNKVFYIKDTNIYSYDVVSKETEQHTSYPANPTSTPATDESGNPIPSISLTSISVIDDNTLGFGKCEIVTGDFGCGLFTLNLETEVVSTVKELGNDDHLSVVDFFSSTKFAYEVRQDDQWFVAYVNGASTVNLEDISIENEYGRGGFVGDSNKIRFSPDGTKLLHISTSSPRNSMDFNTYVYTLADSSKVKISKSTHPKWLNDSSVVYVKYGTPSGMYVYDLTTSTSSKIEAISDGVYGPEVLTPTLFAYTDYTNKSVKKYDVTLGAVSNVADSAVFGFWVNDQYVVYEAVGTCPAGDEACLNEQEMAGYIVSGVKVVNIATGQIDTISNLGSVYTASTMYR